MVYEEIKCPLRRLLRIMERLQEPDGCPWDLKQTHESLKPYLIEEAYEYLEAIDSGDADEMTEELGDVLLQVMFHSVLASRHGKFHVDDVANSASSKMIARHPHVFGDTQAKDAEAVLHQWERLKQAERTGKETSQEGAKKGALSGVPKNLPALLRAQRYYDKAARVSGDWASIDAVRARMRDQFEKLDVALSQNADPETTARQLGDTIFAMASISRVMQIDVENAVRQAGDRFRQQLERVEARLSSAGREMHDLSQEELTGVWHDESG